MFGKTTQPLSKNQSPEFFSTLYKPEKPLSDKISNSNLSVWHLLKDTIETYDGWGNKTSQIKKFPAEVYFFHPIAFIHHLKLLSEKHFYLETTEFKNSVYSALFPGGMLSISFSYKGHILYYPKGEITEDDFRDHTHIEAAIGAFFSKFLIKKMTLEEITIGHELSETSFRIPIQENPMEKLHWFGYKPIRRGEWDCSSSHGEYNTTVGFHVDARWVPYEGENANYYEPWADSIDLLVRHRIRHVTEEINQRTARLEEFGFDPEKFEKIDANALEQGWFRYVSENVAPDLSKTIRKKLLNKNKVWFNGEEHKHHFHFRPESSTDSSLPTISFDNEVVRDMLLVPLGAGVLKLEMSVIMQTAVVGNSKSKINVLQKTVDLTGSQQGGFSTSVKFSKQGMIEVSAGAGVKLPLEIGNLKAEWVFQAIDLVPKLKLSFESNPYKLTSPTANQKTKKVLDKHIVKPRFELLISYFPNGSINLEKDKRVKEKPFQVSAPVENTSKYHSPTILDDLSDFISGISLGDIAAIVGIILTAALAIILSALGFPQFA